MIASKLIYDISFDQLVSQFQDWGEPSYRAIQFWQGLYKEFWNSPNQFINLPLNLRTKLFNTYIFSSLRQSADLHSQDGLTTKLAYRLFDDEAIETVLMDYDKRKTICVSTQSGCAMGCTFCATGQMGFHRNLTLGEIVEQVINYARSLNISHQKVTNIVMMGMGEPFHNYEAVLDAIRRLNDSSGYGFGERRITISTVGIAPAIRKFAEEKLQVNLSISLHAASDSLRSTLLPINAKYPLKELIQACHYYENLTRRRISFEWALIQDINDSPQNAIQLSNLLHGILCHVNLIPLNPTNLYAGKATSMKKARNFQAILLEAGIPCTIRTRRGMDIRAGCGQLATNLS